jgi:hypothetical protein
MVGYGTRDVFRGQFSSALLASCGWTTRFIRKICKIVDSRAKTDYYVFWWGDRVMVVLFGRFSLCDSATEILCKIVDKAVEPEYHSFW